MVVQSCERNFADQRLLEFELLQQHGVKMIRASLMVNTYSHQYILCVLLLLLFCSLRTRHSSKSQLRIIDARIPHVTLYICT